MTEYVGKHWREVNSRTSITDATFGEGIKDFKFSVSQGYGFIPSQSYFRVELEIGSGNDTNMTEPENDDNIAFADNVCGNLFNNILFNIGSQPVSQLSNGVAICDILKARLHKNTVYNESIGRAQGLAGHHYDRKKLLNTLSAYERDIGIDRNQIGRNRRYFIWQPSLGIFSHDKPIGACECEIQLNPNQDYKLSCIDTGSLDEGHTIVDIPAICNFRVHTMRFYACLVNIDIASTGHETLELKEMAVVNANIPSGGGATIDEEFTVPASTTMITMFIQDAIAGKNTSIVPSKFHNGYLGSSHESDALSIKDYQIDYAGMTKPITRFVSSFSGTNQGLYQRYIQTALESGQYFSLVGSETFEEWMERGPILHETFNKSADNLATRAHVIANYEQMSVNSRLFLVAHYTRTVVLTRQNGAVVDVKTKNN